MKKGSLEFEEVAKFLIVIVVIILIILISIAAKEKAVLAIEKIRSLG